MVCIFVWFISIKLPIFKKKRWLLYKHIIIYDLILKLLIWSNFVNDTLNIFLTFWQLKINFVFQNFYIRSYLNHQYIYKYKKLESTYLYTIKIKLALDVLVTLFDVYQIITCPVNEYVGTQYKSNSAISINMISLTILLWGFCGLWATYYIIMHK